MHCSFGRKGSGRCGLYWALVLFTLWPGTAAAVDHRFGLELADTYFVQDNYLDRFSGLFDRNRRYNLLTIAPTLALSLEENALVYVRGDLQWTYEPDADPQRDEEDSELETYLTSAYLSTGNKRFQLILGLQPFEIGSRLITTDDAPGVTAAVKHDRWSLTGQAAQVMESSPMAALTLGYTPGPFEHLALFGAWFRDDEDAFAKTLPDPYQLLDPTSQGQLWWLGASAELFVGRVRFSVDAAYELGEITFEHRFGRVERDVKAYVGDMAVSMNFGSWMSAELFFFTASGDDDAWDRTVRAFVSPLPYNPRALIFFDPEWLDRNTTSVMTYGGSTFRGVVAPGVTITFAPVEDLLVQAGGAVFYPQASPEDEGDCYGWEMDLQVSYPLGNNTEVYLDAARFEYDTYFEDVHGQVPDAALRFVLGCRASF